MSSQSHASLPVTGGRPPVDVFSALAYYYDNRDTFEQLEGARSDTRREGERRTSRLLEDVARA